MQFPVSPRILLSRAVDPSVVPRAASRVRGVREHLRRDLGEAEVLEQRLALGAQRVPPGVV